MEDDDTTFSREVGQRLRAMRRERRWSLEDMERVSGGRWSASAIGAYERGYRNLSLPRLQELARFYEVPMSTLLGEDEPQVAERPRVVLDLTALETAAEGATVARFAEEIRAERGDETLVLSIRRDDLRALCMALDVTEDGLFERLREWGVLVEDRSAPENGQVGLDAVDVDHRIA